MNSPPPSDAVKPALNFALWAFIMVLAVLYALVTFQGLNSPAAMDQAQVAREIARGHGLKTLVIRPAAVRQMQDHGHEPVLLSMPETARPPLQPLLLAPVFKLLEKRWAFDTHSSVYLLDRAAACVGAVLLLLTLVLTHGIARRLFDRTLANFTVLGLALSRALWDLAVTSGPRMTLVFFCTLALWLLVLYARRVQAGTPSGLLPLMLGLCAAAMVMTHLMAAWLVLALVTGIALAIPGRRLALITIALLPALALAGWGAWNAMQCGDPTGAAKATLQTMITALPEASQMRDYDATQLPVMLSLLLRKLNVNLGQQLELYFPNVLGVVPAALFFLALLHRFRRLEINAVCRIIAGMVAAAVIGMAVLGLNSKSTDDNQILCAVAPVLAVFGMAALAVLWARLSPGNGGAWTLHGYAWLAIIIGGWPMSMGLLHDLKKGLFKKDELYQPGYFPLQLAKLDTMLEKDEIVVSDAPWATAWYGDRASLWLPRTRDQLTAIKVQAEHSQQHIAGIMLTPICAQDTSFYDLFSGPYGEWVDLPLRGSVVVLSRGYDLAQQVPWLREFPKILPLGAVPMPDGRRVPALVFYGDRDRLALTKEEARKGEAPAPTEGVEAAKPPP